MLVVLVPVVIAVVTVYLTHSLWPYFRTFVDRWRGRLPGGPVSYPFIGTPGIDCVEPWLLMQDWSERYGQSGIFTYFQGPHLHVAICNPALAKILYNDKRLDGKAESTLKSLFAGHALAFSDLNTWKELRKIEVSTLKDLRKVEYIANKADQNAQDMVNAVSEHVGKGSFSMRPYLFKYVANGMADVSCGPSLRSETIRFRDFFQNFDVNNGGSVAPHNILNVFPWLANFPPFRQQQAQVFARMAANVKMMADVVREHRETYDPEVVRDFVDALFLEQDRLRAQGSKTSLNDTQVTYMIIEMYFAGYVAILAMIEWGILLLASESEVQRRCQEEILTVIGKDKIITYNERHLLPYCEATFHEITRIATVDPVGLARQCTEDTPVPGTSYVIPKGATIFINYYEFQTSERYWKDPFMLQPERFLDKDGKFKSDPNNYAFGIGRRSCSGDQWARDMSFVALVTLIQHFKLQRADSMPWQKIPRINGIGVYPDNYEITVTNTGSA